MLTSTIVENDTEFDSAVEKAAANGLRIAAISNAGLKPPRVRITFLPESCFLKPGEVEKPSPEPIDVRELVRNLPFNK